MAHMKIVCYSPISAEATLTQFADSGTIGGGAKNMTSLENEQFKRARLIAAPVNGGTLEVAKAFLEEVGWTCYWDGPAPKDTRFELRLSADEKVWVLANGGAEMIRTLIRVAQRAAASEVG